MLANTIITALVLGSAAIGGAQAAAVAKRDAINDGQIANIALTLEFLESTFYNEYLGQFDAQCFEDAGFAPWVRERLAQIGEHEAAHVQILNSTLASVNIPAVEACTYKFPVTDPASFVAVASVLEAVGVGAYLGAAPYITSKGILGAAGAILTTESRHQAWIESAVLHGPAWSTAYDTAITVSMAYSAAAQFITSCPSTNPALPVTAFTPLTISAEGAVSFTGMASSGLYVALLQGLDKKTYPITNGMVSLPATQGFAFAVVTTEADITLVTDANTVAGPMIFYTKFLARDNNPAPTF